MICRDAFHLAAAFLVGLALLAAVLWLAGPRAEPVRQPWDGVALPRQSAPPPDLDRVLREAVVSFREVK